MWAELLSALALVFILEGLLPFMNPGWIRQLFVSAAKMTDSGLRFVGLSSMLCGALLLYVVRYAA